MDKRKACGVFQAMERRGAAALDTVGGWGGGRGRRCGGRGGVGRGGERGGKDVDDFGGEVDSGFSPGMFFFLFLSSLSFHFTSDDVDRQTRRY